MHSPTELIATWFDQQDIEIQQEFAFLIVAMLEDDREAIWTDKDVAAEKLRDFLKPSSLNYRTIGKAICFAACANYILSNRSTEADWAETRTFFEDAIRDEPKLVESATRMLATLPERKDKWIATASEWKKFEKEHLERSDFQDWIFRSKRGD